MREREKSVTPGSLAGSLLLAHPSLKDGNFRRTVVLMSSHGQEGAMGVVLNRPTGRKMGDLNGEFSLGPLASIPVFSGGPVQPKQLILAGWQPEDDGFRLYFGLEPERAGQLAKEEGTFVRGFLGYAGWTGGQLETELKANAWLVVPMPPDLMDYDQGEAMWQKLFGSLGWEWKLLAREPDDPSVN